MTPKETKFDLIHDIEKVIGPTTRLWRADKYTLLKLRDAVQDGGSWREMKRLTRQYQERLNA